MKVASLVHASILPHISRKCSMFAFSSNFCSRNFSANFSSSVRGCLASSSFCFRASLSAIFSANFFLGFAFTFVSSLFEPLLLSSSESLLSHASLISSSSSSPSHLSVGTPLGSKPSASKKG